MLESLNTASKLTEHHHTVTHLKGRGPTRKKKKKILLKQKNVILIFFHDSSIVGTNFDEVSNSIHYHTPACLMCLISKYFFPVFGEPLSN